MPVVYRRDVRPQFHLWITEGFARYETHRATAAGLKLADALLNYLAPDGANVFTYQLEIARVVRSLRDSGVTARDLLCRVAELVAWMEANPGRLSRQREEDFFLARGVIHLVRWKAGGKRHGARVMQHLGPLIREHCYPWALGLVRKLNADQAEKGTLRRQSGDFSQ